MRLQHFNREKVRDGNILITHALHIARVWPRCCNMLQHIGWSDKSVKRMHVQYAWKCCIKLEKLCRAIARIFKYNCFEKGCSTNKKKLRRNVKCYLENGAFERHWTKKWMSRQWLCACVIILGTYLCPSSRQDDSGVKWTNFLSGKRTPHRLTFKFLFQIYHCVPDLVLRYFWQR